MEKRVRVSVCGMWDVLDAQCWENCVLERSVCPLRKLELFGFLDPNDDDPKGRGVREEA